MSKRGPCADPEALVLKITGMDTVGSATFRVAEPPAAHGNARALHTPLTPAIHDCRRGNFDVQHFVKCGATAMT